jgi:hypothetical protein
MIMELNKKELDYLDLEVDPREVTEEEHLATLAFIAACKDYKKKREKGINGGVITGIIKEPEGVDFVVEPHEVTEEEHSTMLVLIAARKEREKEINKRKRLYEPLVATLYGQP